MTEHQKVHIAMINSYNVITGKCKWTDVLNSNIPYFAHTLDGSVNLFELNQIIFYFRSLEMFEECAKLQEYLEENFDKEGNKTEEGCACDYPVIKKYSIKTICSSCKKKVNP
jgi:hypothetical protein